MQGCAHAYKHSLISHMCAYVCVSFINAFAARLCAIWQRVNSVEFGVVTDAPPTCLPQALQLPWRLGSPVATVAAASNDPYEQREYKFNSSAENLHCWRRFNATFTHTLSVRFRRKKKVAITDHYFVQHMRCGRKFE